MSELVTATELSGPQFLLLEPGSYPARTGPYFNRILQSDQDIYYTLKSAKQSRIVAVDFETKGGDYSLDIIIMGMGLAWDKGSCYIPGELINDECIQFLREHSGLIAHNVYFDGGVCKKVLDFHPKWYACTYALLSMLHNESPESRWGLKDAQVNLLGWSESNDLELEEWLCVHGYYRGARRKEETQEELQELYNRGSLKPDKGEMWRAPTEILGKYCALDAESTYLLFLNILEPALQKFPGLDVFLRQDMMHLIKVLIDQRIHGILMDKEGLHALGRKLLKEANTRTDEFLQHPDVAPHVAAMEEAMLKPLLSRNVKQFNKDGSLSKTYLKWKAQCDLALKKELSDYRFNIQSGPQLRELLYTRMGMVPKVYTEKGEASTGVKALRPMGGIGNILLQRAGAVKSITFINKYLELLEEGNRNTLHPSFRSPGTITGRLTSKEPNLQQTEKTVAMLSLFQARPGTVWVDLDFCLHPDTEYLTPSGWKKISEIQETDLIWQVDPQTLRGSWTLPLRIIRRYYEGTMYSFGNKRGRIDVTENHRMYWSNQKRKDRAFSYRITASQERIPSKYYATMQTSTTSDIRGYCPTYMELNTACLLQADSYFDGKRYHVQLSMPAKRKEAEQLLGRPNSVYPPREKQTMEVAHWTGIQFSSLLLRGKSLWLEDLDTANADALVSCLARWDGSTGRSGERYYFSTDYVSIDQVQRYLVRCGYECKLSGYQPKYPGAKYLYKLFIRKSKGIRLRKNIDDVKTYQYSGEVGCVTVPSGIILVRYQGQTVVTGNCALEPTVATEFSQDKNMLQIYGDGRPANDIYLYVGAHIPGMRERILATGYDPYNPSKEGLKRAKQECKHDRSICKTVVLACQYGAGIRKVHQTLEEQEIHLDYDQVAAVHSGYWDLFAGVKDFGKSLYYEWRRNRGYILNGIGRPMAVSEEYNKDLLNRFLQSTGHDILVRYIRILAEELDRNNIPWKPIIIDFHDASTIEVPEHLGEAAVQCFNIAMDILNKELGGSITLKGTPVIGRNLAGVKEPEE